jgi:hypothetical protein
MKTPQQAIVWELWRTSRFELLSRIGLTCLMILLMFGIGRFKTMKPEELVGSACLC